MEKKREQSGGWKLETRACGVLEGEVSEDAMIHSVKYCSDIKSNEVQELTIIFINVEALGDLDKRSFRECVGWMS